MNAVPDWLQARNRRLAARLQRRMPEALHAREFLREGVLKRVVELTIEAVGCEMPLCQRAYRNSRWRMGGCRGRRLRW